MSHQVVTNILLVDDQPDEVRGLALELESTKQATVHLLHPDEITSTVLVKADLVLLDYQLESWKRRDELGDHIGLQPLDGISLSAVLRSQIAKASKRPPTAFAIYTGKIDKLAAPLPPQNREHTLARLNNIEWVFVKGAAGVAKSVLSLASAIQKLPAEWPSDPDNQRTALLSFLGYEKPPDSKLGILDDIEKCLPPVHELSQWSHGLTVIRWLLHRILPFPCFLWDDLYLAARLRLNLDWLKGQIAKKQALWECLKPSLYRGVLSDFGGERWWRSAIEGLLWDLTEGASFDAKTLHQKLENMAGEKPVASVPDDDPVVLVDEKYLPVSLGSVTTAVRIMPDDWPPYADSAWAEIGLVKAHPHLIALVVEEDKGRLK